MSIKITVESLPSLFQSAQNASMKAQRNYLNLIKTNILLMILSVSFSVYAFAGNDDMNIIPILSALFIGSSLIITAIIFITQFDRILYDGKTVAESVKTLSWKYMMRAEPFDISSAEQVNQSFIESLRTLLLQRDTIYPYPGGENYSLTAQITSIMKEVRELDLPMRKKIYLAQRITDQRLFYSKKSEYNKKRIKLWFIIIIFSQLFALLSAIMVVNNPQSSFNFTGLFATVAASALSWLQLRQYQELSFSYGLATQELGLIHDKGEYINNEGEFSKFVSDSENTIQEKV